MWIDNLVKLVSDAPLQGYSLIAMALIIAGAMVWVSIDDIFHQEIYFWKLLIAGATTIVLPFIVSLLMGNWTLAACIFAFRLVICSLLAGKFATFSAAFSSLTRAFARSNSAFAASKSFCETAFLASSDFAAIVVGLRDPKRGLCLF